MKFAESVNPLPTHRVEGSNPWKNEPRSGIAGSPVRVVALRISAFQSAYSGLAYAVGLFWFPMMTSCTAGYRCPVAVAAPAFMHRASRAVVAAARLRPNTARYRDICLHVAYRATEEKVDVKLLFGNRMAVRLFCEPKRPEKGKGREFCGRWLFF